MWRRQLNFPLASRLIWRESHATEQLGRGRILRDCKHITRQPTASLYLGIKNSMCHCWKLSNLSILWVFQWTTMSVLWHRRPHWYGQGGQGYGLIFAGRYVEGLKTSTMTSVEDEILSEATSIDRCFKLTKTDYKSLSATYGGWTLRPFPGLVNFAPAVAYHFCLNLPAAFSQPGNSLGTKSVLSMGLKNDHDPQLGILIWVILVQ